MNYKEILNNVISYGKEKQPTRMEDNVGVNVANSTIGTFCEIFRHNMKNGFPATTLRKLPIKSTMIELEGFINGITDKNWYIERGCAFWNQWSNPIQAKKEFLEFEHNRNVPYDYYNKKISQFMCEDLGPIYGYQWRNFNGQNFDQLKSIVDKLKTNPYDRRMVCSAWNPLQMEIMALPPCHYCWTVVVYEKQLNLCWKQRSCDLIFGVPNNIVSYATLLLLLCKESGLEPGELVGVLEDCHIYKNQLPGANALLSREEKCLPKLEITSNGIFDWTYKDYIIKNYHPYPNNIDLGLITV